MLREQTSRKNRQIIIHHGLEEQLIQLTEECAELTHAACRLRRSMRANEDPNERGKRITDLKLEIADVLVVLDQIMPVVEMGPDETDAMVNYKIDREIARIANGAH